MFGYFENSSFYLKTYTQYKIGIIKAFPSRLWTFGQLLKTAVLPWYVDDLHIKVFNVNSNTTWNNVVSVDDSGVAIIGQFVEVECN